MYCKKCGTALNASNVCPNCLTQAENETFERNSSENDERPAVKKYSGKSIAGFVLSLVGILVGAIPCGILGIILSALGQKEIDTYEYQGRALATSGLVISIIDVVFGVIFLAL